MLILRRWANCLAKTEKIINRLGGILVGNECSIKELYDSDHWKVLIIDDDNFVHIMIKEILKSFRFEDKPLTILSAHSSVEALNILNENKDVALVLLDVFIEEENTGLKLSKYIREVIGNKATRIVLMTNRGSQKLEEEAILNYDINGYEEKVQLLTNKLYTVVIASLRSYRDIMYINNNRRIMEEVVASSSNLFEKISIQEFISSTFWHLNSIINLCREDGKCSVNGLAALRSLDEKAFRVIAGYGRYSNCVDRRIMDSVSQEDFELVRKAYKMQDPLIMGNRYISYYYSSSGVEGIIFIETKGQINHMDRELLDIFHKNISAAFESLCLNKEIEATQREILYLLGEVTEARSEETGNHVKRVSKYSHILAEKYGLSPRSTMLISMASPIHDIGKVAIPDSILLKPGKLTSEEFDIVKTHTTIGYNLLKGSNRELLKSAAIIAYEHHERYDGKGYPQGLKGDEIHIFGRIVAVADVFDALGSPRVYKKPWVMNDILKYFKEERGKHFDPDLIDILFNNLDEFIAVKEKFSDKNTKVIRQVSQNIIEE
ncbi:hypothetical protein C3E88_08060 [Clostridium sp. Cult3]|nr:response regulator [Clostridium sp. Cult3]MCF6461003.1 hypothetical protein [Clostridium sp. Cult3]